MWTNPGGVGATSRRAVVALTALLLVAAPLAAGPIAARAPPHPDTAARATVDLPAGPGPVPPSAAGDGVAWAADLGGTLRAAVPAGDGGAVVVGTRGGAGYAARLAPDGSVVWERTFATARKAGFHDVVRVADGYVLVGVADSRAPAFRPGEAWAVKLAPDGRTAWNRTYGTAVLTGAVAATDGPGVVAVGNDFVGEPPVALAVGADGAVRWRRTYPGRDGILFDATPVPGGDGYVLVGANAADGLLGGWALGVNATGGVRWEHVDDYPEFDRYEAVAPRAGGASYVVARQTEAVTVLGPGGQVEAVANVTFGKDVVGRDVETGGDRTYVAGFVKPATGYVTRLRDGRLTDTRTYGGRVADVEALGSGTLLVVGGGRALKVDRRPPTVALASNRTAARARDAVRLTADASDNDRVVAYEWDFDGDGAVDRTTNGSTVVHRYGAVGRVRTRVVARDDAGRGANATVTLSVRDGTPPDAALSVRGPAVAGAVVTLDARNSTDVGRIVAYQWDLDADGRVDRTTDRPWLRTDAYPAPGTHAARVTVVDGGNNTDAASLRFEVVGNDQPRVTVTTNATGEPGRVRLSADVTNEVGEVAVEWAVDGEPVGHGRSVVHEFGPGTHVVRATAADAYGRRDVEWTYLEFERPATPTRTTTVAASKAVTPSPTATPAVPSTASGAPPSRGTTTGTGPGTGVAAAVAALLALAVALGRRS